MDMLPLVKYPFYEGELEVDGTLGQLFPFRTFAMIMSFVSLILVSLLTHYLFVVKKLTKFDFLKAFEVRFPRFERLWPCLTDLLRSYVFADVMTNLVGPCDNAPSRPASSCICRCRFEHCQARFTLILSPFHFQDEPSETVTLDRLDKYQEKGETNLALERNI